MEEKDLAMTKENILPTLIEHNLLYTNMENFANLITVLTSRN